MSNLMIHTPEGFREYYGEEEARRQRLMRSLHRVFETSGYSDIETPAVEFFDVFGSDVGTTPSNELYKFFDRDGHTLVLRPDFTPSVARAVAMHRTPSSLPVRLCYQGQTYVNSREYQLHLKEQITCDLLKEAGLTEFQVSVGENDYFKALAQDSGLTPERIEDVRRLISNKNFFGVSELLESEKIQPAIQDAFVRMPQLFGGREVLEEAARYAVNDGAKAAIARLIEISRLVADTGNDRYISYDFGLLSKFHYYTGMIFSAFTYGVGEPVAKGGRYDRLLGHFGMDAPAVGVGVSIDQLMNALARKRAEKEA